MGKTFSTGLLTNGVFQDTSNNIGIGAAPSGTYKLEVTGTAKVSSTLLVSGAATFSSKLAVNSPAGSYANGITVGGTGTGLMVYASDTGNKSSITFINASNYNYGVIGVVSGTGAVGGDVFGLGYNSSANTTYTSVLNWTSGGNVGIGIVPSAWNRRALQVQNSSLSTSGNNMFLGSNYYDDGANNVYISSGFSLLYAQQSGDHVFYTAPSGTAGGTIAYSQKMNLNNAGVLTINGLGSGSVTATSGVLSAVSDMNLKIEDGYINNALDKVMNLKPRYYHWKEESGLPTDLRQLGFYAQEVNEALGEEAANTPKTENDKWGIYDRGMIAFLTAAIQEQQEMITSLQEQINELKNK